MENQTNMFSTLNLKPTFPFQISKFKGFEKPRHLLSMDKDIPQYDDIRINDFPEHLFEHVDNSSPLDSESQSISSSFSIALDKESLKKPMPVYGHIMTADQPQNVSLFCSKLTPSLSDGHISKADVLIDKWNDGTSKFNYTDSSTSENRIVNADKRFFSEHSNYYDCCNIDCNILSHKYSVESLETQNYDTISQESKSAFPLEDPTQFRNTSQNSTTNLLTIASQKLYELVSGSNDNYRPESISASSDAQSYHSFGNESLFHHDIVGKQQPPIQKGTSLVFSTDKATAIRSVTTPVVFLCRPQESRILLRMTVSLIKTYQIINEMYYSKKRRRTTEHISSDDSFHRDTKRFLNTCNCSNNEVVQCHNDVDWCSKKRYHHHHHRHNHHHHHIQKTNDIQDNIDMPTKRRHHKHLHPHHHHHKHSNDPKIEKKHLTHDACCLPKCSHCNTNSGTAKEYLVKPGEVWMNRYSMDLLIGTGSFGQVVRANDLITGEPVAIKIIRNRRSFVQQAETEIRLLRMLAKYQEDQDVVTVPHWGANCIVRLKSHFMYRGHLCLVFELLTYSLYELLKNTSFSGVSLNLTKKFGLQLCSALHFLSQPSLQIIHCDLKPENVLLVHPKRSAIKVVDFGSSCRLNERLYVYIQSRFYRAPEVLLYLPYNMAIDMWSLGCILVELHTGQPLFVGQYEHEQILRIIEVCGMPPDHMIRCSKRSNKYFIESEIQMNESGNANHISHEPKVFRNRDGKRIPFEGIGARKLSSIIGTETGGPDGRRKDEPGHSPQDYACFLDLINRMLTIDPFKRITPEEALKHPFFCCAGRHSTLSSTADLTSIRNSPS